MGIWKSQQGPFNQNTRKASDIKKGGGKHATALLGQHANPSGDFVWGRGSLKLEKSPQKGPDPDLLGWGKGEEPSV